MEITERKRVEKIRRNKKANLECIFPNKYKGAMEDYPYWVKRFKDSNPEKLRDSLGNLALLQYYLNKSIKQKPYIEKVKYYKGEGAPKGK